ncbi:MAG: hypothetical protein CR997_12910 [Acidobacteria bacterium]|nr:MAG: hypothetical protein CR997_12910 [Acidobacteriota bacterium]
MFCIVEAKQWLLFCICGLFLYAPLHAQDPEEALDKKEDSVAMSTVEKTQLVDYYQEGNLAQIWANYLSALKQGKVTLKDKAFEEMRDLKRNEGDPVFESLGYLFLQKANEENTMGNYESARENYLHAIQMNPYLWPAYVNLGHIKLKEGKGWKSFVSMYLKGFRKAFDGQNTYFLLAVLDWFCSNLIWILISSFSLYCLIVSLKYTRQHLFIFLSDKNSPHTKVVLGVLTLVLPLLLGLNLYLVAACYLIIFFPFFSSKEKRNTYIVSLFLLIVPLLYGFQYAVQSLQVSKEFKHRNKQFYLGDSERQIADLSKLLESSPNDEFLFSLSVLKQKRGDYQSALANYDKLPEKSEFWAYGQINKGNIFYLGHKFQEAIEAYEEAVKLRSSLPEVYYNLSAVRAAMGNHREAEQALIKAKNLDPVSVESWEIKGHPVVNVEMADVQGIKSLLHSIKVAFVHSFKLEMPLINPWIFTVAILIACIVHSNFRNPRLQPQSCVKCGKLYYPSESPNSDWCSQCVHIYMLKSDLPSEAKIKKHEEVKKHIAFKNRLGFLIHLVLPGAKGLLGKGRFGGWLTLLVWVFLLRFSFISLSSIPHTSMSYMSGVSILSYFMWGTTAVFWLIFGLRAAWQED